MKAKESFVGFEKREYNPIVRPQTELLLKKLLRQSGAKNALEIGTYIGYSAAVMLETNPNLQLTTLEKDAENFEYAVQNLREYGPRVRILLCDAIDFLKKTADEGKNTFDFVFLDGPKGQYVNYLPYLKKLLARGGILVADDILFYGQVQSSAAPKPKHRAIVKHLRDFLANLQADADFETQILQIEDGVAVAVKK